MKRHCEKLAVLVVACILFAPALSFAQSDLGNEHPTKADTRTAQALYEEANDYLEKKFAEFNKQKLAYDPKLEANTKQQQKDLAVRNAATIEAPATPVRHDF